MSRRRILVTGGAGFIGSHLVADLVSSGDEVRVYDDFSSGCIENLREVVDDVEIVEGSILDVERLGRAMEGCTHVSHQAAQLEILACTKDPVRDLRINTEGTVNVLRTAMRHDVERVVYASSACVYGQSEAPSQDERHPTRPNWAYGVSKLAAEHYARLHAHDHGLASTGLRYGIVYGPREWYGRVLTAFLRRALDGLPPVLWGRGRAVRDFVFVRDVVDLHRRVLASDRPGAEVLNVGTGAGTSIAELAETVRKVCGIDDPVLHEDLPEGAPSALVAGRIRLPSELRRMVLDSHLALERYGWSASTNLATGLARTWAWLQENRERWRRMRY